MTQRPLEIAPVVQKFINQYKLGKLVARDISKDPYRFHPVMHAWGRDHRPGSRVQGYGADFRHAGIYYVNKGNEDEILAGRRVSIIYPGKRTDLTYWGSETGARSNIELEVSNGIGELVLMKHGEEEVTTEIIGGLDEDGRTVSGLITPGTFYAIRSIQPGRTLAVSTYTSDAYNLIERPGLQFAPTYGGPWAGHGDVQAPEPFLEAFKKA